MRKHICARCGWIAIEGLRHKVVLDGVTLRFHATCLRRRHTIDDARQILDHGVVAARARLNQRMTMREVEAHNANIMRERMRQS